LFALRLDKASKANRLDKASKANTRKSECLERRKASTKSNSSINHNILEKKIIAAIVLSLSR
jgi:hypothetical protein